MRSVRISLAWVVLVALALWISRQAEAADDSFVGAWQVKCTPKDESAALGANLFEDGFLFEGGQFSAQAYAGLGFSPENYTVDETGKFIAVLNSPDRGSVRWSGRLNGGTVYGWITWTRPDGTVFRYTFTGKAASTDAAES